MTSIYVTFRAMSTPAIDTASVDPVEFARQVGSLPDKDLEALMTSELRGDVLQEIFQRMVAHFRPERAEGTDAVVHWKILDRPGGGYDLHEIVIADGTCAHHLPPEAEPTLTLRVKPVDFLKIITNNANPTMLFFRGRLKVQGDLPLAARLAQLFSIPKG
jgi:putative sterol carrier protein